MEISEVDNETLVQKARDLKGLDKIKDAIHDEIRRRVESGIQLGGVSIGASSMRKKMKSSKEIAEMLLPLFCEKDLYEENEIKGRLTIS